MGTLSQLCGVDLRLLPGLHFRTNEVLLASKRGQGPHGSISSKFGHQMAPLALVTKLAKVSKIGQKTRIQGAPYLGFNFNQNDSLYFSAILPKCAPNRLCGCLINVIITMACTTCSK